MRTLTSMTTKITSLSSPKQQTTTSNASGVRHFRHARDSTPFCTLVLWLNTPRFAARLAVSRSQSLTPMVNAPRVARFLLPPLLLLSLLRPIFSASGIRHSRSAWGSTLCYTVALWQSTQRFAARWALSMRQTWAHTVGAPSFQMIWKSKSNNTSVKFFWYYTRW